MRWLYSLGLYLIAPLVLLRLAWRSRRAPAYRQGLGQRFGFVEATPADQPRPLWVHAVSVGETLAAVPLVRALKEQHPEIPILVTSTTPTGAARVRAALGEAVRHSYLPYDLPGSVNRFLHRTRPRLLVVMESELWPNLFCGLRRRGIPVVIANGRLSQRSFRRYQRFAPRLTAATLGCTRLVAAQSEADAERFRALGAARVVVPGNLKFDLALSAGLQEQAAALKRSLGAARPALIAASTHAREEEQVLAAFAQLRQALPQALLILVPRHPERFDEVAALVRRRQWRLGRRSAGSAADCDVYLGDTMGELPLFYAAADLAFVGGSLVPTGGHNVLEASALGLPVLFGPHMFNFTAIAEILLEAGAARQVGDADALGRAAVELLGDPVQRGRMGEAGRAVVAANRGALARTLEAVQACLPA